MQYEFNKESLLKDVNDLAFISQFICYTNLGKNRSKMYKKLKKLINHIENEELNKFMSEEWMDDNL